MTAWTAHASKHSPGFCVKHVALRCAGFNSIDLAAAKELGFSVTRFPAYSPYAVALLLALNRKIPRANNRVRDLNFALNGLVGFDLHGIDVVPEGLPAMVTIALAAGRRRRPVSRLRSLAAK